MKIQGGENHPAAGKASPAKCQRPAVELYCNSSASRMIANTTYKLTSPNVVVAFSENSTDTCCTFGVGRCVIYYPLA